MKLMSDLRHATSAVIWFEGIFGVLARAWPCCHVLPIGFRLTVVQVSLRVSRRYVLILAILFGEVVPLKIGSGTNAPQDASLSGTHNATTSANSFQSA